MTADHVVLALPPPLLRRIAFDPPLSGDKVQALDQIKLENVTRAWVQTSERFWVKRGESGRVDTDSPLGPVRDESEGAMGATGVLGLYVKRREARRLAELPDDERQRTCLEFFELAQPGVKETLVAASSKCWSSDPYQQGAYVYFSVGQLTSLGPALARPEGRLHFAGDHASHRPGFMHGALAAADRVVEEISEARATQG